ncbi:MAG TPA: RNA-binding S4 domain-containing protein [Roseiflexaceae bacterium]|nr:RNA-binding S4 domain-containing protein [Roseiflexaceae bacterium]
MAIRSETISLGAFLKLARLVATGGEAKLLIQRGEVRVNGVVERRRGRQLRPGDEVHAAGVRLRVQREER